MTITDKNGVKKDVSMHNIVCQKCLFFDSWQTKNPCLIDSAYMQGLGGAECKELVWTVSDKE